MAFVSCAREQSPESTKELLGVRFESPVTRGVISGDTGQMTWTIGDEIAVCSGSGSSNEYSIALVNTASSTTEVSIRPGYSRRYYAVYPAASVPSSPTSAQFSAPAVVYPATYDYRGKDAQTWSPCPMAAVNSGGTLTFYHTGGLLRVAMDALPSGTSRVQVVFNGLTHVTGTYNISGAGTASASPTWSSGGGNTVTVTVDSDDTFLNIPLPAGDYSSLTRVTFNALGSGSDTPIKTRYKDVGWQTFKRGEGRTVNVSWADFTIDITKDKLTIGETALCTANLPSWANDATWSSSNSSVATVSRFGLVTAVADGTTTITASYNGATATKVVSVSDLEALSSLAIATNEYVDIGIINPNSYSHYTGSTDGTFYGGIQVVYSDGSFLDTYSNDRTLVMNVTTSQKFQFSTTYYYINRSGTSYNTGTSTTSERNEFSHQCYNKGSSSSSQNNALWVRSNSKGITVKKHRWYYWNSNPIHETEHYLILGDLSGTSATCAIQYIVIQVPKADGSGQRWYSYYPFRRGTEKYFYNEELDKKFYVRSNTVTPTGVSDAKGYLFRQAGEEEADSRSFIRYKSSDDSLRIARATLDSLRILR